MSMKVKGTVKWFNNNKGFGFIHHEGQDYFVHFSSILSKGFKTLPEGAMVLFKSMEGDKGKQALEVELVEH